MNVKFKMLIAGALVVAGCDIQPANEVISDVPQNDSRIVARNCLDAIAAESGIERGQLFSLDQRPQGSGLITKASDDPANLPWSCITDSSGAIAQLIPPS